MKVTKKIVEVPYLRTITRMKFFPSFFEIRNLFYEKGGENKETIIKKIISQVHNNNNNNIVIFWKVECDLLHQLIIFCINNFFHFVTY